jgi:osmoprotectant transport system ATP-binding protein
MVGPSGAGKSTVLRLLLGLVQPDGGQVLFDTTEVCPRTVLAVRRRVGYLLQDGGLFLHLTAYDNITLMARHLRWPDPRILARVAELAALTQLGEDRLARYPSQLSGGQRQRVGLMRALMLDPDAVLLDEPLAGLDPILRAELQVDLRRIFRELGKTVVLVTHDLSEAHLLAHTLVLMRDGQVVQTGTLEALRQRPVTPFVRRFFDPQLGPGESVP